MTALILRNTVISQPDVRQGSHFLMWCAAGITILEPLGQGFQAARRVIPFMSKGLHSVPMLFQFYAPVRLVYTYCLFFNFYGYIPNTTPCITASKCMKAPWNNFIVDENIETNDNISNTCQLVSSSSFDGVGHRT